MRLSFLEPGLALPVVACAVIVAAVSAMSDVEARQQPLPSARAIIDRHIKEIGGKDAILAQTSTHAIGTVTLPGPGLTGKLETFHGKPNKFVQRMSLPGIGNLEEGFDGVVGWSISPLTGPTVLDGKQLEQRGFDADFYEELKQEGRYSSMTTVEKTTFQGRPVYKVRLVKKNGEEDIEFYDAETGLKAGGMTSRESPMGPIHGTTVASDYKQFGPLRQPSTMKVSMMNVEMIMSILTLEYGKVDPSVFSVPTQIKALIK